MSTTPVSPGNLYLPDPSDPTKFYPFWDPRYSEIQRFYNNLSRYAALDSQNAALAVQTWKQWSVGAVMAKDAGQLANYRSAPVAPDGHVVSWNGTTGVISDSGKPVWSPDPSWNVNDWETSQSGTGEDLVKINDPARTLQNVPGGAFGLINLTPEEIATLRALLAKAGTPA